MSVLLREAIGGGIRRARTERNRTLRDVSHEARVSLGYLSEIERGRKEPSSELLAAICEALALPLPDLLDEVADALRPVPRRTRPVAVLDPALRSAVEEALESVQDGEGAEPAETSDAPEESVAVDTLTDTLTDEVPPSDGVEVSTARGGSPVVLVGLVPLPADPALERAGLRAVA